jgi:hypothetical protein
MNKADLERRYPHLFIAMQALALDNDMNNRVTAWQPELPLETQAARLSAEELDQLASGEYQENRALVGRHGVHALDAFLEACFEGELAANFSGEPGR